MFHNTLVINNIPNTNQEMHVKFNPDGKLSEVVRYDPNMAIIEHVFFHVNGQPAAVINPEINGGEVQCFPMTNLYHRNPFNVLK